MKKLFLLSLSFNVIFTHAQLIDSLNTAKHCLYMKPEEREMIYEINLLRSNPAGYVQYIQPMLIQAQALVKNYGKGEKNYSLTITTSTINNKAIKKVDTTWHYRHEEELKALTTLVKELKTMKKLSVLKPDSGIYNALNYFAADQDKHDWKLIHTGSDGSHPWDRITRFSPSMKDGNENGAAANPMNNARQTVIQLLIDAGIPGYGHRYNLLDKHWTHVACFYAGLKGSMYHWIQNFGAVRN